MGLLRFRRKQAPLDSDAPPTAFVAAPRTIHRGTARWVVAIFFLAAFSILYVARDFFIPIALAVLFTLVLTPAVRLLRRAHLPTAVGAAIVLLAFLGVLALAGYLLADPMSKWIDKTPEMWARVSERFQSLVRPIADLKIASERHSNETSEVQAVPIEIKQQPGMLKAVAAQTGAVVSLAGTTFILLYFLLAAGEPLLTSILAAVSNAQQRKRVLAISHDIKQHVSKYLLAVTLINVTEGALIAAGLALSGMPTPMLWGALHTVLNFIPYIGAITGLAITALASFVSFDTIARQLIPPAIYLAVMVMDNFASPMVLGRRLVLNPALVFTSLMMWGWLWGVWGILIAVPILLVLRIICEHIPEWERFGRILTAGKTE